MSGQDSQSTNVLDLAVSPTRFRLHCLSIPHTLVRKDFNACAYTMKVYNFCKMMMKHKHTIFLYAHEGSDVPCTELVPMCTEDEVFKFYNYDKSDRMQKQFKFAADDVIYEKFNTMAIDALKTRLLPGDMVLSFFGHACKPVLQTVPPECLKIEPGIGYDDPICPYQVHESQSNLARCCGRYRTQHPHIMTTVIPNYIDVDMFPVPSEEHTGTYWLCLGRVGKSKGVDNAYRACLMLASQLGQEQHLVIAGQGITDDPLSEAGIKEGVKDGVRVEYRGYADIEARRELLRGAKGVFILSRYLEPFGGFAVESMASGVPVIVSNWGAFPETVVHGRTGFLTNGLQDVMSAMLACNRLNRKDMSDYARTTYGLDMVSMKYNVFFERAFIHNFYQSMVCATIARNPISLINNKVIDYDKLTIVGPVGDYTYSAAYFGRSRCNIINHPALVVSNMLPSIDKRYVCEYDQYGMTVDENAESKIPLMMDLLSVEVSSDEDIEYIRGWVGASNGNVRSALEFVSEYSMDVTTKLMTIVKPLNVIKCTGEGHKDMTFSGFEKSTDQESGYTVFVKSVDETLIQKEMDKKRTVKVALWTETKWALGRIARGLKKYSKKCKIDIIDWSDEAASEEFWLGGWKNYDIITGNCEVTNHPFGDNGWLRKCPKGLVDKFRIVKHSPFTDGWYGEVVNEKLKIPNDCITSVINMPAGVDLDVFKVRKFTNEIKRIGFIGDDHNVEAIKIKRPQMHKEICDRLGCEQVILKDFNLDDGMRMYDGVDMILCTSVDEAGPLGMFEAAACGKVIMCVDGYVGSTKDLEGLIRFDDNVDAAVKAIEGLIESGVESYAMKVASEVVTKWGWHHVIDKWDDFMCMGTEPKVRFEQHESVGKTPVKITNAKALKQYEDMTGQKTNWELAKDL